MTYCPICGAPDGGAHDPKCWGILSPLVPTSTVPLPTSGPAAVPPPLCRGSSNYIGCGKVTCSLCYPSSGLTGSSPPMNLPSPKGMISGPGFSDPTVGPPLDLRSTATFAKQKKAAGWKGSDSMPYDADVD
jgi:hypothetical protein